MRIKCNIYVAIRTTRREVSHLKLGSRTLRREQIEELEEALKIAGSVYANSESINVSQMAFQECLSQ